jgi:hypothetical protein
VERDRPKGVFLAGVLTVLGALGLWYVTFIFLSLGQGSEAMLMIIYYGLFGGGGALSLVDAVLVFRGMRAGYFLSIILWVVIFAVDIWWVSYVGLFSGGSIISFGGVYFVYYALYSVVCFAYFMRSSVRTYFDL